MTTSTPSRDSRSGPTLSCLTGAIVLREGARAVGSTFARQWDPAAPAPALPAPTPSSLPVVAATPAAPVQRSRRLRRGAVPRVPARPIRRRSLPWSLVGAFALGATLAALAGVGLENGSLGFAALAAAVAGGVTLAAGLAQAHARSYARALQKMRTTGTSKPRAARGGTGV